MGLLSCRVQRSCLLSSDPSCLAVWRWTWRNEGPAESCCSIRSWGWPSPCPALPRSSWQPRRPWGAIAKSQSLRTIGANSSLQNLPLLQTMTISNLRVFFLFFKRSYSAASISSVFLCWLYIYLTFVPCSKAAYSHNVSSLSLAATACLCVCSCWHWLLCISGMQDQFYSRHFAHRGQYSQRIASYCWELK